VNKHAPFNPTFSKDQSTQKPRDADELKAAIALFSGRAEGAPWPPAKKMISQSD
jgi:hypothetical protein